MKKLFILSAGIIFLFHHTFAQALSKEEKKRLKAEVKNYLKDLSGYQAKMEDIRVTLDSNDAEIKRQKDDIAAASAQVAELENKVSDYDKQLKKCEEEKNILQGNPSPGGDTTMVKEIMSAMNATPKTGTIYKVQIGLYKEFNINKYFEQPRYIGYEDVDGMNRYIISYFKEEKIAMDFLEDVKKMGIKDAFVAKYDDGRRVYEWSKNPKYKGKPVPASLGEALEMESKGKNTYYVLKTN